jgi:hypothetical protein
MAGEVNDRERTSALEVITSSGGVQEKAQASRC